MTQSLEIPGWEAVGPAPSSSPSPESWKPPEIDGWEPVGVADPFKGAKIPDAATPATVPGSMIAKQQGQADFARESATDLPQAGRKSAVQNPTEFDFSKTAIPVAPDANMDLKLKIAHDTAMNAPLDTNKDNSYAPRIEEDLQKDPNFLAYRQNQPLTPEQKTALLHRLNTYNATEKQLQVVRATEGESFDDPAVMQESRKIQQNVAEQHQQGMSKVASGFEAGQRAFATSPLMGDITNAGATVGQQRQLAETSQASGEAGAKIHPVSTAVGAGLGSLAKPENVGMLVATAGVGPATEGLGAVAGGLTRAGVTGAGFGSLQTAEQIAAGEKATPITNFIVNTAGAAGGEVTGSLLKGIIPEVWAAANPGKAAAIRYVAGYPAAGAVQAGVGVASGQNSANDIVANVLTGMAQHGAMSTPGFIHELSTAHETVAAAPIPEQTKAEALRELDQAIAAHQRTLPPPHSPGMTPDREAANIPGWEPIGRVQTPESPASAVTAPAASDVPAAGEGAAVQAGATPRGTSSPVAPDLQGEPNAIQEPSPAEEVLRHPEPAQVDTGVGKGNAQETPRADQIPVDAGTAQTGVGAVEPQAEAVTNDKAQAQPPEPPVSAVSTVAPETVNSGKGYDTSNPTYRKFVADVPQDYAAEWTRAEDGATVAVKGKNSTWQVTKGTDDVGRPIITHIQESQSPTPQPIVGASEAPRLGGVPRGGEVTKAPEGGQAQPKKTDIPLGPGKANADSPEFSKPTATGIKKSESEHEREQQGLPPRKVTPKADEQTVDNAIQKYAKDPTAAQDLIDEMTRNPRPHTDEEVALLIAHKVSLTNAMKRAQSDMSEAASTGNKEAVPFIQMRMDSLRSQLTALREVSENTGTVTARGLRFRKNMLNEGYTLTDAEADWKAAKGGKDLTPAEKKNLGTLVDKLDETQKAVEAKEQKKADAGRKKQLPKAAAKAEAEAMGDDFRDSLDKKSRDFPEERKAIIASMKDQLDKGADRTDLGSWIQRLFKTFVAESVKGGKPQSEVDREASVTNTHSEVEKLIPGITRNEVVDAISGYGDYKQLSKEEADARTRQYKQELQLGRKLDALGEGNAPLRSGMERQAPSDAARAKQKEVAALMKKLGIRTTDPATQLKSSLDAMKTRMRNEIADRELAIASGKKLVKPDGTPIPKDNEAMALESHVKALRQTYNEIFGEQKIPQEDLAMQRKIAAVEQQIADNSKRIAEGDIEVKKGTPGATTPELDALRAHNERLNKTLAQMRRDAEPGKTQDEIDAGKVKTAIATAQKSLDEYNRRIESGELWPGEKKGKTPTTPELDAIRAKRDAAAAQLEELQKADTAHRDMVRSKALQESIESLKTKLEKGEIGLADAKVPDSPEIQAQKNDLKLLRHQLEEAREAAGIYDDQRIKDSVMRLEETRDRLAKKLATADTSTKEGTPRVSTPEIERLRAEVKDLSALVSKMKANTTPKLSPEVVARKAWQTRTSNALAENLDKLHRGEFSPPAEKKPLLMDAEDMALKAAHERSRQQLEIGRRKLELQQRTTREKVIDAYSKWRVSAGALSWPTVLPKLAGYTAYRLIGTPLKEVLGGGIGKIIPGISSRAPREGGFSMAAEKAAAKGTLEGAKQAWEKLKSGKNAIDVLHGDSVQKNMPQNWLSYIANLHGAIKSPAQYNEFERSVTKRTEAAVRAGLDPTEPAFQAAMLKDAYLDSERAILQNKNVVSSAINAAEASLTRKSEDTGHTTVGGQLASAGLKTVLPITKVPANFVGEVLDHVGGLLPGGLGAAKAYIKGVDKLSPVEADAIMRHLKNGSVGPALILAGFLLRGSLGGFYAPGQKKDDTDVPEGAVSIDGHVVPKIWNHNPAAYLMQLGATMGKSVDGKYQTDAQKAKGTGLHGVGDGSLAAGLGLLAETPYVNSAETISNLTDARTAPDVAGKLASSALVPGVVQYAASKTDSTPRKPSGFVQNAEMGIPGLRQTVPTKDESKENAKTPKQQMKDKLITLYRTDRNAANAEIQKHVDAGTFTADDAKNIRERGNYTEKADKWHGMSAEEAVTALEGMTPAERTTVARKKPGTINPNTLDIKAGDTSTYSDLAWEKIKAIRPPEGGALTPADAARRNALVKRINALKGTP